MNIKFNKLHIHGFMSFDDAELEFDNNGYVLVSGRNNNIVDNAQSNGSGKSSIWESIVWALTGDTIRGTKDVVNHSMKDGCFVELNFTVDNSTYELLRSKNHSKYKTNLILVVDGEDKSGKGIRDTEKLLKDYLPDVTSSLLGSVIILGQGLPDKFSNNTPSGRKEILEKLSKSDFMIEDLKSRVSTRQKKLSIDLRTIEDSLLSDSSQKSAYIDQIRSARQELESFNEIEYETRIEQLRQEIDILKTQLPPLIDSIDEIERRQSTYSTDYNSIVKRQTEELALQIAHFKQEKEQFHPVINGLKIDIAQHRADIKRYDSVKDTCPTCGQKLPDVTIIDTTELKSSLSTLMDELERYQNQLDSVQENHNETLCAIKSNYEQQLEELKTQEQKYSSRKQKATTDLEILRSSIDVKQEEYNNLYVKLQTQEAQKDSLTKRIQLSEENVTKLENQILYNTSEKGSIEEHITVVSKFESMLRRDFRGFLLSSVIEYIDKKAKEYCQFIFGNDRIEFTLDGNNISILFDGKEIESLSGGERQKVDLVIQFSLRDMLCMHIGFRTNILVLDEIFDNLDSRGCQQVIDLISQVLVDVSSIYIVTHRGDLAIPYDDRITVIKDEHNLSHIKRGE